MSYNKKHLSNIGKSRKEMLVAWEICKSSSEVNKL